MSQTDLIKELRALTQAGMKDCKEALQEAEWDLQKAVDIVKVKGLNIADGRTGRVASDGLVSVVNNVPTVAFMVEVNCQTDFVANSPDFQGFVRHTVDTLRDKWNMHQAFQVSDVEEERKALVAITKENIAVRRWWIEEALRSDTRVFSYVHSNSKIGVVLTLRAPSFTQVNNPLFTQLGEDLAMQVAAMNPLAVSVDRLSSGDVERQKDIFRSQLKELNKPVASWGKILDGKFRKWQSEVCLLEQESVIVQKTTVAQVIQSVAAKLGGDITVVNFVRCQVGEGIEVKKDDLAEEVAKLM
jgi:elongation factor Ts